MMNLESVYKSLFEFFGPQYWWPGDSPWEIAVGAILTQQVAWKNVEKAISNLKENDILCIDKMMSADVELLKACIRPSGFFNQKTEKLLRLARFVFDNYGSIELMLEGETYKIREELLSIKGIGPETADSILCYAGGHEIFVVDAYTKRLARCTGLPETEDYHEIQRVFMDELQGDNQLYNEYHALIVGLGKVFCKKINPLCHNCPIRDYSVKNSR